MVIAINKQEVKYIKKYFLTEKQRKSRSIKQAEQVGNTQIDFIGLDGKTYKLIYRTPTKTYTNYVDFKEIYNTGIMHKGNNVRVQDKYNKVNHAENNLIKKIDKNNSKKISLRGISFVSSRVRNVRTLINLKIKVICFIKLQILQRKETTMLELHQ